MENPTEKTSPSIDERDLILSMRKLDLIKELGDKQSQLQNLQTHLHQNTDLLTRENQVLREFRKELDMLVQERMSHIEELRLIHADINIMETTIKQAEEERIRALQESKRLLKDYQPMKEQINKLREMLNLDKVPDNEEDDVALMTMQLLEHDRTSTTSDNNPHEQSQQQQHPLVTSFIHPSQPLNNNNSNSINSNNSISTTSLTSNNNNNNQASGINVPKAYTNIGPTIDRSAFRQQPPPMKTCQSCQQQIHRNAPICPICKAKSRSRNPKKPKRRLTDLNS